MFVHRTVLGLRPCARYLRVGDLIPDLRLALAVPQEGKFHIQRDVSTASFFEGKKVVVVGFPGAFTPTCTATHIPDYVKLQAEFAKKNVTLVGMAVNDPFVLKEFAEELKAEFPFIADGAAVLTKALDVGVDLSEHALGFRCRRFAFVAVNGRVAEVYDERSTKLTDISKAETVLKGL